jgi:hypothetical protein
VAVVDGLRQLFGDGDGKDGDDILGEVEEPDELDHDAPHKEDGKEDDDRNPDHQSDHKVIFCCSNKIAVSGHQKLADLGVGQGNNLVGVEVVHGQGGVAKEVIGLHDHVGEDQIGAVGRKIWYAAGYIHLSAAISSIHALTDVSHV